MKLNFNSILPLRSTLTNRIFSQTYSLFFLVFFHKAKARLQGRTHLDMVLKKHQDEPSQGKCNTYKPHNTQCFMVYMQGLCPIHTLQIANMQCIAISTPVNHGCLDAGVVDGAKQ